MGLSIQPVGVASSHSNGVLERLRAGIAARTARVAVIGLGYVGLPLAVEKAKVGFHVLGFEDNPERMKAVNSGDNYIKDVSDSELRHLVLDAQMLEATADFTRLAEQDIIVICVPTPLTITRDPDISYIQSVTDRIAENLRVGQLITLESTTYPGTTQEVILPRLAATGLEVGRDFFLAFSPERVDPGNKRYTTNNISKVVGGVTPACTDIAATFYAQTIQQVVPDTAPAVAEMTKVFENTYRAVNIALVNELMLLCDRMGLDVWEVVDAAATKPFGIQTFYPGPGVGGHCIPIDPFYLTWKAREYGFHTRFIELAGQLNSQMPYYVVERVARALNEQSKGLRGSHVLILGMAYKKNIDDWRESPVLPIVKLLQDAGAELAYHDPYVEEISPRGRWQFAMTSVPLTAELLANADCVLITTDHDCVDYEFVVKNARLVVDTRNATRHVTEGRQRIRKI